MKPVVFHPAAEAEIDDEVAYYENRATGLGQRLQDEVEAAVAAATADPNRWPVTPGTPAREFILPTFPFAVVYRDTPVGFSIYALAHHKRKPGYWKSRLRSFP